VVCAHSPAPTAIEAANSAATPVPPAPVPHIGPGAGAATIAAKIEAAIADGSLAAAERLPTIRDLAAQLRVSPATVAAAYRTLGGRGLVSGNTRLGTVVAGQPPLRLRGARPLPAGARDLASGNPDPALLPPLEPALARLDTRRKLYGGPVKLDRLTELARADFAADGIDGDIAVAGGALDAIERVLQARLRPGDKVVVEDPGWPRIHDLVQALGLRPEPVRVDQRGLVPDELEAALRRGAHAVITTPRGQNPTGGAVDAGRAGVLCELLSRHPATLVIEDDYVAAVCGAPYTPRKPPSSSSCSNAAGRSAPASGTGTALPRGSGSPPLACSRTTPSGSPPRSTTSCTPPRTPTPASPRSG
jgi:DNA-binding transcriptional MocR family regulator